MKKQGHESYNEKELHSSDNPYDQGKELSPRASRKKWGPVNTLILVQWDPCWISEVEKYKMVNFVLSATKLVVICFGSNIKLTHEGKDESLI